MEHLGPLAVNNGRSGTMGGTPQGSPRLVRSWSKGKLNRRSAEFDSDTASSGKSLYVCMYVCMYICMYVGPGSEVVCALGS